LVKQSKGECTRKKFDFCPKANKDEPHTVLHNNMFAELIISHATWTFMNFILLGLVAEFMVWDV